MGNVGSSLNGAVGSPNADTHEAPESDSRRKVLSSGSLKYMLTWLMMGGRKWAV